MILRNKQGILRQLVNLKDFRASSRSASTLSSDLTGRATDFWRENRLEDLPEANVNLELLRRHNSSFPYSRDQVIVGRIVGVERDHVAIYSGHKTLTKFAKKELHLGQLVRSRDARLRSGPRDFRIGDVLHFILEELETPFGDVGLRVMKPRDEEKFSAVWEEIREHHANKTPVMGRILNPVNKGYCVGIAGLTTFLPYSLSTLLTASKVGVLQPFLVQNINPERRSVVLADPALIAEKAKPPVRPKQVDSKADLREPSYSTTKALTRNQLRYLVDDVRKWAAVPLKDARPRRFPKALAIALTISWKSWERGRGYLNRLQLEHMISQLRSEMPPAKFKEILELLEYWGINTVCRPLKPRSAGEATEQTDGKASEPSIWEIP